MMRFHAELPRIRAERMMDLASATAVPLMEPAARQRWWSAMERQVERVRRYRGRPEPPMFTLNGQGVSIAGLKHVFGGVGWSFDQSAGAA